MHLVMRYLCFFGIVKRQGVKRRMDKRSTSEEQKSGYLGLTRADEERHLADVISVAQQNLERAGADIRKVNEDLADLLETYDVKDKEGLALWNNATARLKENQFSRSRAFFSPSHSGSDRIHFPLILPSHYSRVQGLLCLSRHMSREDPPSLR